MASGRLFQVQIMHLGPNGTFASFNEASLPFAGQLGMVIEDDNKVYRLVKFDNGTADVASAAKGVAHWKDRSTYTVTSDCTDAEMVNNGVAGIFLGVLTDGYYGFVQIGGLASFTTGGGVSKGDAVVSKGVDLTGITMDAVNQVPFAVANVDDEPTYGTGYLLLGNLL